MVDTIKCTLYIHKDSYTVRFLSHGLLYDACDSADVDLSASCFLESALADIEDFDFSFLYEFSVVIQSNVFNYFEY